MSLVHTLLVSQLINKLRVVLQEEGDIPVFTWDNASGHINLEDEIYVVNQNQDFAKDHIHKDHPKIVLL